MTKEKARKKFRAFENFWNILCLRLFRKDKVKNQSDHKADDRRANPAEAEFKEREEAAGNFGNFVCRRRIFDRFEEREEEVKSGGNKGKYRR